MTFNFPRHLRAKLLQTILLVLLSAVSGGAAADYVRWTATSVAGPNIPEAFSEVVAPGGPISLTVWIDLSADNLEPNTSSSARYELAQVQGRTGSYVFNSSISHELWVYDGASDGFQVTVVGTAPPNAKGFTLGQFAFAFLGGPEMLADKGIPLTIPNFSGSEFDVEACPSGLLSCTAPWGFAKFSHGSTITAQIVSSLTPVPVPTVSIVFGAVLIVMTRIFCKRTRA